MQTNEGKPATITVERREVYGQRLFYPVCPRARKLAEMMQRKTFGSLQIRQMCQLGFDVIHAEIDVTI